MLLQEIQWIFKEKFKNALLNPENPFKHLKYKARGK